MKKNNMVFLLLSVSLMSCSWEGSYRSKSFLHYTGSLMACRDIHGADLLERTDFNSYPGENYTSLFDQNASELSLGVAMTMNQTYTGVGHLKVVSSGNNDVFIDKSFDYYLITSDPSGGHILSSLETDGFIRINSFVYINATWSRITIPVIMDGESITLSFQFWCVSDIGYPKVFDH